MRLIYARAASIREKFNLEKSNNIKAPKKENGSTFSNSAMKKYAQRQGFLLNNGAFFYTGTKIFARFLSRSLFQEHQQWPPVEIVLYFRIKVCLYATERIFNRHISRRTHFWRESNIFFPPFQIENPHQIRIRHGRKYLVSRSWPDTIGGEAINSNLIHCKVHFVLISF